MNILAPMKNCPGGVQGNLNWMPGYLVIRFYIQRLKVLTSIGWSDRMTFYRLVMKYYFENKTILVTHFRFKYFSFIKSIVCVCTLNCLNKGSCTKC